MKVYPAHPVSMDSSAGLPHPSKDCVHFLRTGTCRYGMNCRFNHPGLADSTHVIPYSPEFPERIGQPDCQFYLKTGTCRFGAQCKYHHPRVKAGSARGPPLVNLVGLPMRQGEKECAFYLRTGICKFGLACKFHHPEPAGIGPAASPVYSNSPPMSSATMPSWPITRPVYFPPTPYMPIYAASIQSMPYNGGWNSYQSMGTPPSNGEHHGFYNGTQQHVGLRPGFNGALNHSQKPDQPDCQYYMQTGHCKFGANCRFNHPKSMALSLVSSTLSPMGLPLRPGQPLCAFYLKNGICKFGPLCRFDHPIRSPSVSSPSTLSFKEPVKVTESVPPKMNTDGGLEEPSHNGHDRTRE